MASSPAATSETLTLYGRALLQDGRSELAERTLEKATTRYPIEPSAFLFYSIAAERQNDLEAARKALIDYGAVVASDADLAARATRIALLSLSLNDPPTAVRGIPKVFPSLLTGGMRQSLTRARAKARARLGCSVAQRFNPAAPR